MPQNLEQRLKTKQRLHNTQINTFRMWTRNNYCFLSMEACSFQSGTLSSTELKAIHVQSTSIQPFFHLTNCCHECLESWEEGLAPSQARLTCFLSRQLPIRRGHCSFILVLHSSPPHASKLFTQDTCLTSNRNSGYIPLIVDLMRMNNHNKLVKIVSFWKVYQSFL